MLVLVFFLCLWMQGGEGVKLLVGADMAIHYIETEKNSTEKVLGGMHVTGIDYDFERSQLFFADVEGVVKRLKLPAITGRSETGLVTFTTRFAMEIAVDWVRDRLYLINTYGSGNRVTRTDSLGNNRSLVVHPANVAKVDQLQNTEVLRDVYVDPYEKLLFMGALESLKLRSPKFKVITTDLDGRNVQLNQNLALAYDSMLTVDVAAKKLYVLDNDQNTLYICGYNGTRLARIALNEGYLLAIHAFKDEFYWVDIEDPSGIFKVTFNSSSPESYKKQRLYSGGFREIHRLKVYDGAVQSRGEFGQSEGCSGAGCCPTGQTLASDNKTCQARDQCNPSPCGPFSWCQVIEEEANCGCLEGFLGHTPYCYAECTVDSDCGDGQTCSDHHCVDPCGVDGACGTDASCLVTDHKVVCGCPPGYTGNPSVACVLRNTTCTVPSPADNRYFYLVNCQGPPASCQRASGSLLPLSSVLRVSCAPGYLLGRNLQNTLLTVCEEGEWLPSIPQCFKVCPAVTSLTTNFECWFEQSTVSCDKPVLPGTTVKYSCKEYHEIADGDSLSIPMNCTASAEWSRAKPRCSPKCGYSNLNSAEIRPTILGGNVSDLGNFPWHAGIFQLHDKSEKWVAVCGGTLVSSRAVLTAAHCVTQQCHGCKPGLTPTSAIVVALGKTNRLLDVPETTERKRGVKTIHVHKDYVGSSSNFGHDIAVLELDSEVEVDHYVMPACVDFSSRYVQQLTENKTLKGYVAGWGNTEECSSFGNICYTPSDQLKYSQTTVIGFNECFNISQSLKRLTNTRLSSDKICAGNGSESVVQQGDSGGGLTFVFDGLHYVYGVVSVKLKLEIIDRTFYNFGAFTNVPRYFDWLQNVLKNH